METFINILVGLVFFFATIGVISTIRFSKSLKRSFRDKKQKRNADNRITENPVKVRKRNVVINYTDGYGEKSTREINTIALYPTAGLLKAFCLLRMDVRTFRIDRITKAVEVDSGQIIENINSYLDSIRL